MLPEMHAGDLLAFGCKDGFISKAIKFVTRSRVSHVAIVYQGGADPILIESTTIDRDGLEGVRKRTVFAKVGGYEGDVWLLRLRPEVRERFDIRAFRTEANAREGRQYDRRSVMRVLWRILPILRRLPWLKADGNPKGDFCSELGTHLYLAAGIIDLADCGEPSDVTPVELCEMPLFEPPVLIAGNVLRS